VLTCGATLLYFAVHYPPKQHLFSSISQENDKFEANITASLPEPLLNHVYRKTDFINERGNIPAFWGENENSSIITWGPCYPPSTTVDWNKAMTKYANTTEYRPVKRHTTYKDKSDLSDYCKPGFIIIGQGKCGTSSLYHYIGGHPRVLEASQKQIHYFKVRHYHHHNQVLIYKNLYSPYPSMHSIITSTP
jgi:hypothetical protein